MRQDINLLAYVRGTERYVFLFTDDRRDELADTVMRFAANPELSLTLYDASMLGDKIWEQELAARNRLTFEET